MALIGISVDPVTGQVRADFLTCSVTIPNAPGLHVIPPSCGSGKSTVIAQLAVEKKDSGVLIIVPTKKDADAMGNMISSLGVATSDIMVLHCQNGPAIGAYKDDPWSLAKKKILIITSARVQIDPIDLFLTYGGGVRAWVAIDELINFYPDPFQVPEGLFEAFTFIDQCKTHSGRAAVGKIDIDGVQYYRHIYREKGQLEAAFQAAGAYAKKLRPGRNELDKVKRSVIFEHVIKYGFSPIQQRIQDIAKKTNTNLFDGTADIIFPAKDPRLVPVTGVRYSSDIHFQTFPCQLKRNELEDCQESDILHLAPDFINLATTLSQTTKILVICWKTVGGKQYKELRDRADNYEKDEDTSVGFPDILRRALISAGGKEENIYITYRGSGQDRGSNEYRDCSSVIFLGEWRLPDQPITSQISDMFGLKMKFEDYKKSLIIQTICRSRIRQHTGLPIDVYFSEDINYQMAWEVQKYFKKNSPGTCIIGGLFKPCRILSKPEKGHLFDLTRLYSYDPLIRQHVESGTTYSFSIPLDTLFSLIPKDRKATSRYGGLVKYLLSIGLSLTIT